MNAPANKGRNCGCLVPTGQHAHAPGDAIFPARQVTTALAFAYPLVAHLAVARSSAKLTIAAIALLALSVLLFPGARPARLAWLAVPLVVAAAGGCRSSMHVLPLYLPPVLVPAFLAWVFGKTLLPGRTPLIEQLVHMLHAPDAVPVGTPRSCMRGLTLAWTVLSLLAQLDEPAAGGVRRARAVVAVREPDRLRDRRGVLLQSSTLTGGAASRISPIATCSNSCQRLVAACRRSDARRR